MQQLSYLSKSPQNKAISAYNFMEEIHKDRNVKCVDYNVPYRSDVCLYDVSLDAPGNAEDDIYASDEWYRVNLRRGNTVIQTFDKNDNVISTFYGRRGFEKFFDLMYEYIEYNLGKIKKFDSFGIKDAKQCIVFHGVIFSKANEAIKENKKVAIYKLVKANGENAQISWVKSSNAWIIASKNVSLLARTEQDVRLYKSERFHFARLIAKEWFRVVARLEKEGKIEQLKQELDGKTFVGEYCGNQSYQHLVKYSEVDLHFTAIVENGSTITCISPKDAMAIFDKYNLTHVKYFDMGSYSNWDEFNQTLKKIYIDVAKAYIDDEEEGSVIYLTKVSADGKEEVLSLSKLKTQEYRIYRKLREKLRGFLGQTGSNYRPWTGYYDKFRNETRDLCKEIQPPMPLDYYFEIAKRAFEFGEKYYGQSTLIHDQYITFLSLLMFRMSEGKELTPQDFNEVLITKVLPIRWTEYYAQYHNKPQNGAVKQVRTSSKKVYVVVPIGVPGMGKTYFLRTFRAIVEKNNGRLSTISSDDIRKECMDKLSAKNKNLTTDQLFDQTFKDARDLFNKRLQDLILSNEQDSAKNHFIFIDKNHPPNAIKSTIKFVRDVGNNLDIEIIGLTPLVEKNFLTFEKDEQTHTYPFSANFFFTCFGRVQARQEHGTLVGSGVKSANVSIMFLNMYRNVVLNKEFILQNGFDKHLTIPFTNEAYPTAIPPEIFEIFVKILKATNASEKCNDETLVAKLDELYTKASLQFKNPEAGYIEECINRFFDKEILLKVEESSQAQKEVAPSNNSIVEDKKEKKEVFEDHKEAPTQQKSTNTTTSSDSVKPKIQAKPQVEEKKLDVSEPKKENNERLPTYLGLFSLGNPLEKVKEYIIDGMDYLAWSFPDDKDINKAFQEMKEGRSPLKFVDGFHITTLFIGGNKNKTNSECYKSFKPGHKTEIEIVGFVIVPGKIVTAICYPDQSVIKIENRFPHVTLMKGQWPPKYSNILFEEVFGKANEIKDLYDSKKFITEKEFTYATDVKIEGKWHCAYVVKFSPHLVLPAEARESL